MKSGALSLCLNQASDRSHIILTIAAVEEKSTSTFGGGGSGLNGGMTTGFTVKSGPAKGPGFPNGIFDFKSGDKIVTYFNTSLDPKTSKYVPGPVLNTIFEKILIYEKTLFDSEPSGKHVFEFNDYYVYGYYDHSNKSYNLVRFDP